MADVYDRTMSLSSRFLPSLHVSYPLPTFLTLSPQSALQITDDPTVVRNVMHWSVDFHQVTRRLPLGACSHHDFFCEFQTSTAQTPTSPHSFNFHVMTLRLIERTLIIIQSASSKSHNRPLTTRAAKPATTHLTRYG